VVNPEGVFQVLREQTSCPRRLARCCGSRGRNHLLSEQVGNENGGVALWAHAAQADRASELVAVAAASLAEEALTAPAARVGHQRFAALESLRTLVETAGEFELGPDHKRHPGLRPIGCERVRAPMGVSRTDYASAAKSIPRTTTTADSADAQRNVEAGASL
jgi:hypothetical protein